jgi:lipid-A-disaccharide synthase
MVDLFILAAEPSADLQGAQLIEELLRQNPSLKISAVAGPRMRALPIEITSRMETLQVMGFLDVALALPRIAAQFFRIRNLLLQMNPAAIVCIDYPGFNLRLEKSLRKKGYKGKLIHYICPSVWAWKKKRIGQMEKTLDLLLSVFPFEKNYFNLTKLPVEYVGHPLIKAAKDHELDPNFKDNYHLKGPIIALFPGSRKTEIEKNLPLQLEAAKKLCALDPQLQIAISVASKEREAQVWSLAGLKAVCIPSESTYNLMSHAQLALATSGTVTLELALHSVPTVVTYFIKPLDLFVAKKIFRIKLPFYCIVNIITSSRIYPELFGPNLTSESLYSAALEMLRNPTARATCQKGCHLLKEILGEAPASELAAKKILSLKT